MQGVKIDDTILCQDNMSSILLGKNGRSSSSKRTRHMNIRFFFIKDRVESKEIRIEYCPTAETVADFFTKPLQGKQFYKLRDKVMNIDSNSKYHSNHRSVLNQCNYEDTGTNTMATVNQDGLNDCCSDGHCDDVVDVDDVAKQSYQDVWMSGEM